MNAPNVFCEFGVQRKFHTTPRTRVRDITVMHSRVVLTQKLPVEERLLADFTRMAGLPRVKTCVHFEELSGRKLLVTHVARVWLIGGMTLGVFTEKIFGSAATTAVAANKLVP